MESVINFIEDWGVMATLFLIAWFLIFSVNKTWENDLKAIDWWAEKTGAEDSFEKQIAERLSTTNKLLRENQLILAAILAVTAYAVFWK
jgi:hypothetical protein